METSRDNADAPGRPGVVMAFVAATRPKQWTKNLLVYFALFFTVNENWEAGDIDLAVSLLAKTTLAFALFSALSGAVYLVNDLLDADSDRRHPRKRHRPIASGRLPVPFAWAGAATLAIVSLALAFVLEPDFGWVAVGYLALMLAYSTVLKHQVLLDVFAISGGFVLRAIAGAAVIQAPISPWLYTCTALGALLIALAKRRSELTQAGDSAGRQRETLNLYSTPLLDQLIAIVAPSTILTYTLYTFTAPNLPENHAMMLTIPFVVYGLFRYMFLVHNRDMGESPEDVLITDVPLMVSITLWLASAATILLVYR